MNEINENELLVAAYHGLRVLSLDLTAKMADLKSQLEARGQEIPPDPSQVAVYRRRNKWTAQARRRQSRKMKAKWASKEWEERRRARPAA